MLNGGISGNTGLYDNMSSTAFIQRHYYETQLLVLIKYDTFVFKCYFFIFSLSAWTIYVIMLKLHIYFNLKSDLQYSTQKEKSDAASQREFFFIFFTQGTSLVSFSAKSGSRGTLLLYFTVL